MSNSISYLDCGWWSDLRSLSAPTLGPKHAQVAGAHNLLVVPFTMSADAILEDGRTFAKLFRDGQGFGGINPKVTTVPQSAIDNFAGDSLVAYEMVAKQAKYTDNIQPYYTEDDLVAVAAKLVTLAEAGEDVDDAYTRLMKP